MMVGSHKGCFGILDEVFPMGKEGLRETAPACFDCPEKKACLQTALQTKEGFALRGEVLDRSPTKGLRARLMRWSEKKRLSELMKEEERRRELLRKSLTRLSDIWYFYSRNAKT